ncbi:hypothetical protein [Streptomyces phaeochromogenes]|uniref:hypothetical protein n=1 Tax=Streptomyces phaeochromogenes TaxID=1923 RepID=UPI0037181F9F
MDELIARLDDPDLDPDPDPECGWQPCTPFPVCGASRTRMPAVPDRVRLLPRAVRLLHEDVDPQVRTRAAELVGLWVHQDADTPGGPIHRRTAPKGVQQDSVAPALSLREVPSPGEGALAGWRAVP